MPDHVHMRYLDRVADADALKSQCFLKGGTRVPDIIDDAEKLEKIEDASFDLVLGAHVMEHMPDVLGALTHWVRVLRPGGLLFMIVPDLCDPKFAFGDRFRMVARPAHFIEEYLRPHTAAPHFDGHCAEQ